MIINAIQQNMKYEVSFSFLRIKKTQRNENHTSHLTNAFYQLIHNGL